MMKRILAVIASNGYQDIEYETPKQILEDAGIEVVTASSEMEAKGKLGGMTYVDFLLDEISADDYEGIYFVGGPGCYEYFEDENALELARQFYKKNKLTAAICAAPSILANTGILKDKKATCWEGESENLKEKKADYTGRGVERDQNIITANGPESAEEFGEAIVTFLS